MVSRKVKKGGEIKGEKISSLNLFKALIAQLKNDGKSKSKTEQELNKLPSVLSKSEIHDLVEKYY